MSDTKWTRVNINATVRVKLTNIGRQHYRDQMRAMNVMYPGMRIALEPNEDANGWYRSQLWELMRDFGEIISMGREPPFSTEIEIRHD